MLPLFGITKMPSQHKYFLFLRSDTKHLFKHVYLNIKNYSLDLYYSLNRALYYFNSQKIMFDFSLFSMDTYDTYLNFIRKYTSIT